MGTSCPLETAVFHLAIAGIVLLVALFFLAVFAGVVLIFSVLERSAIEGAIAIVLSTLGSVLNNQKGISYVS